MITPMKHEKISISVKKISKNYGGKNILSECTFDLESGSKTALLGVNGSGKTTLLKILATLTPREERVLRMRFGIGMNTDHTLEEVGLQFSVTRERIRQIEAKALRKLKHPSRSKHLKSFLEK